MHLVMKERRVKTRMVQFKSGLHGHCCGIGVLLVVRHHSKMVAGKLMLVCLHIKDN
jgi:hypothetical protein